MSLLCSTGEPGVAAIWMSTCRATEPKSSPMQVDCAEGLEKERINSWTIDHGVEPGCPTCRKPSGPADFIADTAEDGVVRQTADGPMWMEEEVVNFPAEARRLKEC